ncbi:hypothetical protein IEO70_04025 [Bacillus sp. AGMB 02131]|uniref:Permease n=1 Tax=Peribacillus faecalis TaxID=2772559 RepID=A0A927CUP5_9BACI|nr:hypothetical protein [Peribacillus faecalis]MBD3107524.1 hypothetical protein [Peribacillus faecalis]
MQMSMKAGKIFFITSGIIFLLFSLLLIWSSISTDSFFIGHELVFIGAAVMCFCLANLYPKLAKKDARSKRIRERGLFVSCFFILLYMAIFTSLFQLKIIDLNGYQTISLLSTLSIITIFSSFVIVSKRY